MDGMDGKGVGQLVGKVEAAESPRLRERRCPTNLMREGLQRLLLMSAPGGEWFHYAIIDHRKTIRRARFHFDEDVAREVAAVSALLDDRERPRMAETFPDFRELAGEERSENRTRR